MSLSNRTLWILILIWVIWAIYIFYMLFFNIKLTSLEINSNTWSYNVELKNIKFEKDFFCDQNDCTIYDLPPFEYDIIVKKDDFKIYESKINLSNINKIDILLEKDIKIEKIKKIWISRTDLINKIKSKNIVEINSDNLEYFKIYNSEYSYITKDKKLYFYDEELSKLLFSIDFVPEVLYIKQLTNNFYLIVTEIWTFNFNVNSKDLEYISLFSDFIIKDNNYIWIINSNDESKKINFWYKNNSWNLIVSYDINTKNKFIIDSISNKIRKIYIENNKIYIETENNEVFELYWY